jgi:glucose-6-phosphate 1-epimerase
MLMTVNAQEHPAGFPIYSVSTGDSQFELSTFGGQLLSWTKGGVPTLFSNEERAIRDGKTPYRGGAPICFPYFGKGILLPSGPLAPQHGRARTTVWEPEVRESSIVLRTEQPSPEGFGPTTFSCELTYSFGEGLTIGARIANVGEVASPFQLAVHSYWACENPSAVVVKGLGARYFDNLNGLVGKVDPGHAAPHTPVFDRVYPDAASEIEVLTDRYRLTISTENCTGAVLWNPGVDHGLADLGVPNFVCVESGVISPSRALGPGEDFRLRIGYEID